MEREDYSSLSSSLYSAELFEASAKIVTDQLKNYFKVCENQPHVKQWIEPENLLNQARSLLHENSHAQNNEEILQKLNKLAELYLSTNQKLHSAKYMGHQVPPALPIAALFDWIGSSTNQAPGLYEMGPLPSVVERLMIEELSSRLGWDAKQSGGVGLSGGSIANLVALLAAKNSHFENAWNEGVSSSLKPAIITSSESHYSISRAAGILGIGANNVLKAEVDSLRRMDPQALKELLQKSRSQGYEVFCIVGTACTTPTGAYDPLKEIGEIARENNIWFHVDGAHGASVVFSKKHKNLVSGIELADSVVWDAHKMMYSPALSTYLLYRNRKHELGTFQQDAPYLNDQKSNIALEFDTILKSIECTKRPLAMPAWATMAIYGDTLFEKLINATFERTSEFYSMLRKTTDFIPLHEPQSNILCFRYLNDDGALQKLIRDRLIREGNFYITGTQLDGQYTLRVTIIHPDTTKSELEQLLENIRKHGKYLLDKT